MCGLMPECAANTTHSPMHRPTRTGATRTGALSKAGVLFRAYPVMKSAINELSVPSNK